MKWRYPILLFVGRRWTGWGFLYRPLPLARENGLLDLPGPGGFEDAILEQNMCYKMCGG